jgi:hypothetical protein
MSGNEILLNMQNSQHFRNSEISNSLYELSRRISLPINETHRKYDWERHEYVKHCIKIMLKRINTFNVN